MLDYIFFHDQPLKQFMQLLDERQVEYRKDEEDDMGKVVAIPEDLDEPLAEEIDDYYEDLLAGSEELMEQEGEGANKHIAALTVNLKDGRTVYAPLRPELMKQLMTAISAEEVGEVVDAIVTAVENPDERPICKR